MSELGIENDDDRWAEATLPEYAAMFGAKAFGSTIYIRRKDDPGTIQKATGISRRDVLVKVAGQHTKKYDADDIQYLPD